MSILTLDPSMLSDWDDRLQPSSDVSSVFYSSGWIKCLSQSYGYRPACFSLMEDSGNIRAALPAVEIRSLLTGRRGVSLPFSDHCEPLVPDEEAFFDLFSEMVSHGRRHGWKYIELRGGSKYLSAYAPFKLYIGHCLALDPDTDRLYTSFRASTRRNIRKAQKSGVSVRMFNDLESTRQFYRLHCITRRRHGVPPQPFSFFKNMFNNVIAKGHGTVALAYHGDHVVAGALFLHHGDNALFKYGASDRRFFDLRANNLVMWEAIQWYALRGFDYLHMGRTASDNAGLDRFKSGWNTVRETIHYYRYQVKEMLFVPMNCPVPEPEAVILKHLPLFCLRFIGALAYRHFG